MAPTEAGGCEVVEGQGKGMSSGRWHAFPREEKGGARWLGVDAAACTMQHSLLRASSKEKKGHRHMCTGMSSMDMWGVQYACVGRCVWGCALWPETEAAGHEPQS